MFFQNQKSKLERSQWIYKNTFSFQKFLQRSWGFQVFWSGFSQLPKIFLLCHALFHSVNIFHTFSKSFLDHFTALIDFVKSVFSIKDDLSVIFKSFFEFDELWLSHFWGSCFIFLECFLIVTDDSVSFLLFVLNILFQFYDDFLDFVKLFLVPFNCCVLSLNFFKKIFFLAFRATASFLLHLSVIVNVIFEHLFVLSNMSLVHLVPMIR